jgi:antitoxin ParD1/3/4
MTSLLTSAVTKESIMPTQNVSLTPQLESFVKDQVKGGMFKSASEVHRAALASLMQKNEERNLRMRRLDEALQAGVDDLDNGRFTEVSSDEENEAFFGGIMKRVISKSI